MSEQFKTGGKKLKLKESDAWTLIPRPGPWWIAERKLKNGKVERRRVAWQARGQELSASIGGQSLHGTFIKKKRGGGQQTGDDDLVAQFPGKVRKLLVAKGQKVEEGESLLLVEAMKMEFAVKAPVPGTVEKIHVGEGQQLSPGDRYLDLV